MIGEAVRMASPQKSVAVRYEGSSFTIQNILNLPEDAQDSNGKVSHVPCSSVASSPIRQMYGPPSNTSPHTFKPSGPWPYDQVFFGTQIPSWSMAARFTRHALLLGGDNPYLKLRRRRPMRKTKQRPLFSTNQIQTMEDEFKLEKYLTEGRRAELATELKLTETQVKTWFQNRRTKWRKELKNEDPPRTVPDGRWKHSVFARHCN